MPISSTACSASPAASGSTRSSSPAPISRWSRSALAAAAPRPLAFVDGKEGIARRTAWLTRDQAWPESPAEGVAVFTGPADRAEAYRAALAAYGLTRIEIL